MRKLNGSSRARINSKQRAMCSMARSLFKRSDKAGYVEGRSDEIKNLYWAQRNMGAKDADPRLKHKLTEIVVPAHYDSDGELIEAHREVIEVVQ